MGSCLYGSSCSLRVNVDEGCHSSRCFEIESKTYRLPHQSDEATWVRNEMFQGEKTMKPDAMTPLQDIRVTVE